MVEEGRKKLEEDQKSFEEKKKKKMNSLLKKSSRETKIRTRDRKEVEKENQAKVKFLEEKLLNQI
jgi:hypothetical protein